MQSALLGVLLIISLIDGCRTLSAVFTSFIMQHTLKHWLPVILWMGLIFIVSTDFGSAGHTSQIIEPLLKWLNPDISAKAIDLCQTIIRKGAHLTEYAILALLTLRAINRSRENQKKQPREYYRSAGIALLIATIYAATDEFHQSFVPTRTPSVYDVLIDSTGAFIALTAATLWKKLRGKTASKGQR